MTNFTKLHPEYVDVPNPTLRDAKDAMGAFLGSVRTENGHRFNSPEAEGDKWVVLNDRSIEKLLVSNFVCYEAACNAYASRRTALIRGLVGGAIISAGIYGLIHLINGKGERPKHFDEPLQLPPPSTAVNAHDNDGAVAVPSLPHARKITDEEVELIHAWYESGVSKREIANRLCISVQTVNARIKKYRNTVKQKQDEQQ